MKFIEMNDWYHKFLLLAYQGGGGDEKSILENHATLFRFRLKRKKIILSNTNFPCKKRLKIIGKSI